MLVTIKGYWARVPNWAQSVIMLLVFAGGDYIFSGDQFSWRGLGLALFAAGANWWNTHVGHAVGRADTIVAVVRNLKPPVTEAGKQETN
jgi:hypothetical protein